MDLYHFPSIIMQNCKPDLLNFSQKVFSKLSIQAVIHQWRRPRFLGLCTCTRCHIIRRTLPCPSCTSRWGLLPTVVSGNSCSSRSHLLTRPSRWLSYGSSCWLAGRGRFAERVVCWCLWSPWWARLIWWSCLLNVCSSTAECSSWETCSSGCGIWWLGTYLQDNENTNIWVKMQKEINSLIVRLKWVIQMRLGSKAGDAWNWEISWTENFGILKKITFFKVTATGEREGMCTYKHIQIQEEMCFHDHACKIHRKR